MATNTNSTNYFSPARWVVSTVAGEGTHLTITAATSSASAGDTIVLLDYVSTEDVAMKTGVNYTALPGSSGELTTKVTGKWTYSGAGTVSISNIQLNTNSDNFLAVTGSAASIVNLNNCYLNCSNNTGISFTTSNTAAAININNCNGNLGTTGIGYWTSSSTGNIVVNQSTLLNSGNSLTASTNSSGGVMFYNSILSSIFSCSSSGAFSSIYTEFYTPLINTTPITTAGTGASNFQFCYFLTGTATAISVGSGTSVNLNNCNINSSNTNALSGAGILTIYGTVFSGSSHLSNVTTQTGGAASGLTQGTAPSAGFIGEQITSGALSASLSSGAVTALGSINLTPGIWNIEGIFNSNGTIASVQVAEMMISTTSASFTGFSPAVNYLIVGVGTTAAALSATISQLRATLSATTTYYLNVKSTFTAGTMTGVGVIRATRVG